jgi:hypothetical protein
LVGCKIVLEESQNVVAEAPTEKGKKIVKPSTTRTGMENKQHNGKGSGDFGKNFTKNMKGAFI